MNFFQRFLARLFKKANAESVDLSSVATDEQVSSLLEGTADLKDVQNALLAKRVADKLGLNAEDVEAILEGAQAELNEDGTVKEKEEAPKADSVDLANLPPEVVAQLSAQNQRIADLEAKNAASLKAARLKEDSDDVDKLVRMGVIIPANQQGTKDLLATMSAEQKAAWLKIQGQRAPAVRMGRDSMAEDFSKENGDKMTEEEAVAQATALLKSVNSPIIAKLEKGE